MRNKAFVFSILLSLVTLETHAADCQLEKYGELPVTMAGTQPIIAGTINGVNALFLADSGAFFSTLTNASAYKHKLKLGPLPVGMRVTGVGGAADAARAVVKDFSLAGFGGNRVLHDVDFVVMDNSAVNGGLAGIIGQNLIGGADTEYDLANGFIRMFNAKNCSDKSLAYWHSDTVVAVMDIESRTLRSPHIIGTAKLNGQKIRVVLDTGASFSVLTTRAAARAGIKADDENASSAGITHGLGKRVIETSTARFDDLDLGGEQIKNARLRLGDIMITNGADMLLGADFFLSHRVYVASKQHKIYFTYNGGRVFDLGTAKKEISQPATPTEPTAAADAANTRDSSMDAAAFRLRGAASAGRRDFQSAIADFDQAIKLDANDPENFYQRGLVRKQERQGLLAISDFDQVLKIKPDHVAALMERGTIRLAMNKEPDANADFDAATQLASNDPSVELRIAQLYESTRHYDEAVNRFNRWIGAHPKDDRIATAYTGRCWSRAMTNKELDLALADCNLALKKGPQSSEVFDGRGMVLLLRGDFDKSIADFNTSLKLQPKNPMTLYGLGIAEIKKGSKAEGEKNIHAAVAITPAITEFFKRLNLAP